MIKRLEVSTSGVFTLGELRELLAAASVFPDDAKVILTGIAANAGGDAVEIEMETDDYRAVQS